MQTVVPRNLVVVVALLCVSGPAAAQVAHSLGSEYKNLRKYNDNIERAETHARLLEEHQKELMRRVHDPAFQPHVDLVALGEAWENLDSKRFTIDALNLLNAERAQHRPHKATPAAPILTAAVRLIVPGTPYVTFA